MNLFPRKIYALLRQTSDLQAHFDEGNLHELQQWWNQYSGSLANDIARSSDRVALEPETSPPNSYHQRSIRHPISGQELSAPISPPQFQIPDKVLAELQQLPLEQRFWWLWRFLPDIAQGQSSDGRAILYPADAILPDYPWHSHSSTVSALAGAMFPADWQHSNPHQHPYLLHFSFSPVQEFIKASRKFLDFWAGSYLLHYLSVKLCWFVAQEYGPDAIIVPSLWGQEIIDALAIQHFDTNNSSFFADSFRTYSGFNKTPVERFKDRDATSLSTAGFPNVITILIPAKDAADFGDKLADRLRQEWRTIAQRVRDDIRDRTMHFLNDPINNGNINDLLAALATAEGESPDGFNPNRRDLEKWRRQCCWEWRKLWEAQIENTWEPYWTAIPLGHPDQPLHISSERGAQFDVTWTNKQEAIGRSLPDQPTPTDPENRYYEQLNVGTWWANVQHRLRETLQIVKNTRLWRIPTAPGERSTLSGQFSAVHPSFSYHGTLREGAGVPSGSMQLFWRLMALVYPGLFNGSEKLNALELTKRMAWVYGGVAESLGINPFLLSAPEQDTSDLTDDSDAQTNNSEDADPPNERLIDYETVIRFPNLSSIAAARFARERPDKLREYWGHLSQEVRSARDRGLHRKRRAFYAKTRRPFQVPNADRGIATYVNDVNLPESTRFNGVMFSSKWLADDMGLNEGSDQSDALALLRSLVDQAHRDSGFGDSSPADWWAIVAADGDGMGQYVAGTRLKNYEAYINQTAFTADLPDLENLLKSRKRMGPATHVALNRALLDFSNRLVPYLTEKRFCGRVIYSGGDDVLAVLPLNDVPEFLMSLRAAWCGEQDPYANSEEAFHNDGDYWIPPPGVEGLPQRPLFTMGKGATMSAGIVIAHKSVPLPTVLEYLWSAEEERAKKMQGVEALEIPNKDGLCFRVIYGSGNVLEASMKGHLLECWWAWVSQALEQSPDKLAPMLYRLAEELPRHTTLTENDCLISKAAQVILTSRDESFANLVSNIQMHLIPWLNCWERWAYAVASGNTNPENEPPVGSQIEDLSKLLRFTAFWASKMAEYATWTNME